MLSRARARLPDLGNDPNKFLCRFYGYEFKDLWVFATPAWSPLGSAISVTLVSTPKG